MQMLQVGVYTCDNLTSVIPCVSSVNITSFFETYMIMGRFLAASVVILDTGLNPTK